MRASRRARSLVSRSSSDGGENLERSGVSRPVAMKVTGHKTESIYKRYAIADEDAMREGLAGYGAAVSEGAREPEKVVPIKRTSNSG